MQPEIYTDIYTYTYTLFLPNILIIVRQLACTCAKRERNYVIHCHFPLFSHFEKETRIWDEFSLSSSIFFELFSFASFPETYMGILLNQKENKVHDFCMERKGWTDKMIVQLRCHFYLLQVN